MPPTLGVSAEAMGKWEATLAKQIRMMSCLWPAPCRLSWPIVRSNICSNKDAAEKNHIQLVILTQPRKCSMPSPEELPRPSVPGTLPCLSFHVCLVFDQRKGLSA